MGRFLFFITLTVSLWAFPPGYWSASGLVTLQKDQLHELKLASADPKKKVRFRWTLYKNEGLVMHLSYDGFVHQFVLYRDYQRSAFKLPLLPRSSELGEAPYLMLVFKNYSRRTELAEIEYLLHPADRSIALEQ